MYQRTCIKDQNTSKTANVSSNIWHVRTNEVCFQESSAVELLFTICDDQKPEFNLYIIWVNREELDKTNLFLTGMKYVHDVFLKHANSGYLLVFWRSTKVL